MSVHAATTHSFLPFAVVTFSSSSLLIGLLGCRAGGNKQENRGSHQARVLFCSEMQAADFKLPKRSELTLRLLLKEKVGDTSEDRILKRDRKGAVSVCVWWVCEQEHYNMLLNQRVSSVFHC